MKAYRVPTEGDYSASDPARPKYSSEGKDIHLVYDIPGSVVVVLPDDYTPAWFNNPDVLEVNVPPVVKHTD